MLNVVSDKRKNERMNGMLKIFLTGDNHIGSKYANYGEKATYLAEKRIDAFENMVSIANEEQCSIFAIAGDLFDNWTIVNKKDTIFKYIFWERLDSLPIPECCFHFVWCQIA